MVSDRATHARSQGYQTIFNEIAFSHDQMSSFSNNDSMSNRLCPYQYDERILELEDQLRREFWRVAREALTDRQFMVADLTGKKGFTQQECARAMNVNQSSINKGLNGNKNYNDGKVTSSYGGIIHKLQTAAFKDPEIMDILDKIATIREERW